MGQQLSEEWLFMKRSTLLLHYYAAFGLLLLRAILC